MDHELFKLTRKLFTLTIDEAAANIGGVAPRTWKRWEYGHSEIPEDVLDKMHSLAEQCRQKIIYLNRLSHDTVIAKFEAWAVKADPDQFDMDHKIDGAAFTIRLTIN